VTDRILWNPGDDGDIDEIVIHDCTVHVEQMNDRCWWIGIDKGDANWSGNFHCDSRGRMRFTEQHNENLAWHANDTHEPGP
jgi:hypothetical protein